MCKCCFGGRRCWGYFACVNYFEQELLFLCDIYDYDLLCKDQEGHIFNYLYLTDKYTDTMLVRKKNHLFYQRIYWYYKIWCVTVWSVFYWICLFGMISWLMLNLSICYFMIKLVLKIEWLRIKGWRIRPLAAD